MEELIQEMMEVLVFRKEAKVKTEHIHLNGRLVKIQKLNDDNVLEIKLIHLSLEEYFTSLKKQDPTRWTTSDKRDIISRVEKIEFALQRAWKFEETKDMHSWWFKVPHCSCPYIDNQDLMGSEQRYISSGCLLHGSGDNLPLMKKLGGLI